jgi:hypothetical protein
MRWCPPPKAQIDADLRKTFERYGVVTMQVVLGSTNYFHHNGAEQHVDKYLEPLLAWLTEEYEKSEFRHTWSTTMEVLITVFVFCELGIDVLKLVGLIHQ